MRTTSDSNESGQALLDDSPLGENGIDELNRTPIAKRLARLLSSKKASPSLVLSVEDHFGGGKTSFLKLVEKELRSIEQEPVIFWFNPWIMSGTSDLIRAFLLQLAALLGNTDQSKNQALKDAGKNFKAYAATLSLFKVVPGAEPWISIIENALKSSGDAASAISNTQTEDLNTIREKIESDLKKSGRLIVVFVDDLDRLPPNETATMIQVLKGVSNLRGLHFIAAYEHSQVCSALQQAGYQSPQTYLEKVVQLRFRLPQPSEESLKRVFLSIIRSIKSSTPSRTPLPGEDGLLEFYLTGGLIEVLGNIRNFKRLANAIILFPEEIFEQVNIAEIIAVESLRLCAHETWTLISEYESSADDISGEEFLSDLKESIGSAYEPEEESHKDRIKKRVAENSRRGAVRSLFEQLFLLDLPQHLAVLDDLSTGRIREPKNLAYYYHFALGSGEVSNSLVCATIRHPETVEERLRFLETRKFLELTRRVANALRVQGTNSLSKIVNVLGEEIERRMPDEGFQWSINDLRKIIADGFVGEEYGKEDAISCLKDGPTPLKVILAQFHFGLHFGYPQAVEPVENFSLGQCLVRSALNGTLDMIGKSPENRSEWLKQGFNLFCKKFPEEAEAAVDRIFSTTGLLPILWLICGTQQVNGLIEVCVRPCDFERYGGIDKFIERDELQKLDENQIQNPFDKARLRAVQSGEWISVSSLEPADSLFSA